MGGGAHGNYESSSWLEYRHTWDGWIEPWAEEHSIIEGL